jgi:hypothetical protein
VRGWVHVPVFDEVHDGERCVVRMNRCDLVGEREWCVRVLAVDHVECCEPSGGGTVVVEVEFRTYEVLIPILMVRIDVVAKVSSNVTDCILRLPIRLWMVGSAEVEVCTEGVEEFLPEARSETWVPILKERQWHSVKSEDVVTEEGSELNGRDGHLGRDDVNVFGESIHKDSNGVMSSSCLRERGHEVYGDGVPTLVRDR